MPGALAAVAALTATVAAMQNVFLEDAGAQVVFASSFDAAHPPEHIIDGCVVRACAASADSTPDMDGRRDSTFWLSTGMYPQV